MSRRFLYFAAIGLLVASLIIGLPLVLERVVAANLAERLDRRDLEVSWKSVSWRLPATIELGDVEFSLADDRLRGRADSVLVELPWNAAFAGAPRVEEVVVQSAALTVDLRRAGAKPVEEASSDASSTGGDLSEKLRRIGALRGTDVTLDVVRHDRPLARLTIDDFLVSDIADIGRSIEANGEAEVTHPRLSRLPMGSIHWSASGTMSADDPELELAIGADDPERALIDIAVPGVGRLSAHQAKVRAYLSPQAGSSGDGPSAPGVEVWLHDVAARLGAAKAPAVELIVQEMGISQLRGANPRLVVTNPQLAVSPSRLARVRSLLGDQSHSSRNQPSQNQPSQKTSAKSTTTTTGSRSDLATKISWWLQRLDVSVSQGRFDLRLDQDGEASPEITLVDGLDAWLASGDLWAKGESAGGQVSVGARLEPGMLLPRVLAIQASDVRLDDLPGVKEGRTLPNRGIRGRLGGVLDAQMMLVTEGEPLLRPGSNAGVNIVTSLAWKGGHVELSGLADAPLTDIDAGLHFELEWIPALAKVSLRRGRATYGAVAVDLDAELVDWPFDPVFDLEARMDKIACQEAVRSFPDAMLGAYSQVEIDGEAAPTLRFHLPWHRPRKLRLQLEDFADKCQVTSLQATKSAWPEVEFAQKPVPDLLGLGSGQDALAPKPPGWPTPEKLRGLIYELPEPPKDDDPKELDDVLWLNRAFKKQVIEGVSEGAEVFVGPGTDAYVPMDELPPFVAGAAYLSEEMEFYENHGVDLGLIQKALRIDFEGERFVYGGSTVTQQLVKNLFLSRDKTLSRKLKEALIAWRIEDAVPKWRVLELYLNCIEYAQDVYGIGPAAKYYFGKDARDLTPKEAVFIAVLKPAPWYGDRFRRRGQTPTKHWWFNRIGEIMGRLVDKGYLTPEQAEADKPYVLYWDEQGAYLPGKTGETGDELKAPQASP